MSNGEIFSLIAIFISFAGLIISIFKATKERDHERDKNTKNLAAIDNNITTIKTNVDDIKYKVEKIDAKMQNDHDILIKHDQKITNLEKEVFTKGGRC